MEKALLKPDIGAMPCFKKYEIPLHEWKDGLIVRSPNWLGDAVMTLPALHQLRKIVPPECGLFVICPPSLADFYKAITSVDLIVQLHQAHKLWKSADLKKVKDLHAGVALLFNNSLRDTIYLRLAGIPKIFGASARCRGILLSRSFSFPKIKSQRTNKLHHAAKYLSLACALGAPEWQGELPEFKVRKEPELMDRSFLELLKNQKLMTLAPGAAYGEAKRWPADYFKTVARHWIEKQDGTVAIIGAPKESHIAELVAFGLPPEKVFNLAGKTDLSELMLLLQKSDICVANDSGTMHLSAAVGGKGVAIFGSTDPTSTSPVSAAWKIIFEQEPCAPCFKRVCPKNYDQYLCLKKITPEKVIAEIKKIIS